MKWLFWTSVTFLTISILLFLIPQKENKTTIQIQKEIHYIQTVRHEESRKTDSLVSKARQNYSNKKEIISKMDSTEIESTFVAEVDDTNKIEMMKTCLDWKYKSERDSISLDLMTIDRDRCNEQLDSIVTKTDTLVDINKNEEKKSYRRGLLHGSAITAGCLGIIKFVLLFI